MTDPSIDIPPPTNADNAIQDQNHQDEQAGQSTQPSQPLQTQQSERNGIINEESDSRRVEENANDHGMGDDGFYTQTMMPEVRNPITPNYISSEQDGTYVSMAHASPEAWTTSSVTSSTRFADVATTRWFSMLAQDADLELGAMEALEHLRNAYPPIAPSLGRSVSGYGDRDKDSGEAILSPGDSRSDDNFSALGNAIGAATVIANMRRPTILPPSTSTTSSGLDLSTEETYWRSPDTLTLQTDERFIFIHFVDHVSAWIDLFDPQRHFSTTVPRLALRNVGLLNAILALSIRHLSLNPRFARGTKYERHDALKYYHDCLHYVRQAMRFDSYNTSLELLATALIISAYEMLDGSRRDWERHLQGVFWIQRSQVIHGDSKGLRAAVWWSWLCQDVWAAFRERRKTFTFWKHPRAFDQMNPWELGQRSIFLMSKVVSFCSQEEVEATQHDPAARFEMARTLDSMLEAWKATLTVEFTPLPLENGQSGEIFDPLWIHPSMFGTLAFQIFCFQICRCTAFYANEVSEIA
jgi:hypothetical protein